MRAISYVKKRIAIPKEGMMRRTLSLVASLLLILLLRSEARIPETVNLAVGQPLLSFSLESEPKDFTVQLGTGEYYLVLDMKRTDNHESNIMVDVQLLKNTGSIIEPGFLYVNEIHVATRSGRRFKSPRPMTVRFRLINKGDPLEGWIGVYGARQMRFVPFGFDPQGLKSLGIGTNDGKGGTLQQYQWAHHAISLPSGRWDVSFYFRHPDGSNTNLQGTLEVLDAYGYRKPVYKENSGETWDRLYLNEISTEARIEGQIRLKNPETLIFRVYNQHETPVEYTVGVLKGE